MDQKPPTAVLESAHRDRLENLPFDDTRDFGDADRFIGALEPCVGKTADGRVVWDNDVYTFLDGDIPATVHCSLWRQSQLCAKQGRYEVSRASIRSAIRPVQHPLHRGRHRGREPVIRARPSQRWSPAHRRLHVHHDGEVAESLEHSQSRSRWKAAAVLPISLAGIALGGLLLVEGASGIIDRLGLSSTVVGITSLVGGTSSPGGTCLRVGTSSGRHLTSVPD
jgi:Ca2+/Na+ antiporter